MAVSAAAGFMTFRSKTDSILERIGPRFKYRGPIQGSRKSATQGTLLVRATNDATIWVVGGIAELRIASKWCSRSRESAFKAAAGNQPTVLSGKYTMLLMISLNCDGGLPVTRGASAADLTKEGRRSSGARITVNGVSLTPLKRRVSTVASPPCSGNYYARYEGRKARAAGSGGKKYAINKTRFTNIQSHLRAARRSYRLEA